MIEANPKELFLDRIKQKHSSLLSKGSPYALFMQKAFDHFLEIGLPDKKAEGFGYFPLKDLYAVDEKSETLSAFFDHHSSFKDHILAECSESYVWLHNGIWEKGYSNTCRLQNKILIETLEGAKSSYMPFVHLKMQGVQKKEKDPFILATQAMMQGILIVIPADTKFEKPIQLVFSQDELLSFSNVYIHVGKNSEVEFVLSRSSQSKGAQMLYIDIECESQSKVKIHRYSSQDFTIKLDAIKAHLKKEASFDMIDLSMPSCFERLKLHVVHQDENANSKFNALGLVRGKKQAHYVTCFEHKSPHTTSHQHVKTALFSKAKASFEGQIYVHPEALLTQSYQKHETLMLGDHAIINSLPNLQILADDVKASHGATIAALDEQLLHYLRTRGISEKVAKGMLMEGFCKQMTDLVTLDSIEELGNEMLNQLNLEDVHVV